MAPGRIIGGIPGCWPMPRAANMRVRSPGGMRRGSRPIIRPRFIMAFGANCVMSIIGSLSRHGRLAVVVEERARRSPEQCPAELRKPRLALLGERGVLELDAGVQVPLLVGELGEIPEPPLADPDVLHLTVGLVRHDLLLDALQVLLPRGAVVPPRAEVPTDALE